MDFRILGPLEALSDGRALDVGGHKQRALLALLLLEANQVVSRDRLIDALWEEDPPETVHKALQVYVSQLRKLLGKERLQHQTPGYRLRVEADELDLTQFHRLREEGRLDEALALWRGSPLADLANERFAQPEIARLEELRLACLEERGERELARGRHAELVGELEALVRQHPLRERLRGQLMLCLYRSGRQADALEAYQTARNALVEELGIEPSRALRELHQAILEQDAGLDVAPAAEPVATPARSPFVGREPELAELVAGLDDAFAGRGRLFLLVGEPGIGKSRLAEELIARAGARGARILVGRCWEAGGAPAYWPWVQSLRAYLRESDTAALRAQLAGGAAALAQIVPELRERLPDVVEPPALEPETARFRLFDATAQFLRRASESRPIVLVLDDLHAADAPSLLLLRFVARELGSTRMLVLGACRNVDPLPGRPLADMLAEVGREAAARRLELAGLSEPELAEYVELTASDLSSPALVSTLHEQTEGNPLFAGEIVRLLSVEGRRAIPESVRDVIARRLTHLSEACNRALVLASVLGREFSLDVVAQLSGVSEDALLDLLDEAIAARVVSDVPGAPGHARFAHVLIRDALYEGLTGARRVRLHRRVVEALEALHGDDPGPHLAELAHHASAGRDFDKGLRYAWQAADRALALLAYEESVRLYAAALEAVDPSSERTRCELLLAIGEAEARAGDTPAAKAAFSEAAAIAQRLGLANELARAAVGYGGRILWGRAGDDSRLVPLLEGALAALAKDGGELRARLLARLAGALRDDPSRDRRDALSREAVELARRTGDPAVLAYALDGRASAIVAPDTVAERLAIAGELCEVATRIPDRERIVHGHTHRHIALLQLGDVRGAEAELEAAIRIAHELRQPAQLWQARGEQAMVALAAGRLAEAERLIPDALALGEHVHPAAVIPVYRLQRYTLHDFRGTLEHVEPEIRELAREYPARPVFRCVLAHLHARLGRHSLAKRALAALADGDVSALPFDQEWLFGMSLLAESAALLGDTDSASVLYRLLLPWAALNVVDQAEGVRGAVSRYLGLLAMTTARRPEAARHFEAALAMNARMGARPWLARTQEDYARMLLGRDDPGDRERAQELLAAAGATYRELGMQSTAAPLSETG